MEFYLPMPDDKNQRILLIFWSFYLVFFMLQDAMDVE